MLASGIDRVRRSFRGQRKRLSQALASSAHHSAAAEPLQDAQPQHTQQGAPPIPAAPPLPLPPHAQISHSHRQQQQRPISLGDAIALASGQPAAARALPQQTAANHSLDASHGHDHDSSHQPPPPPDLHGSRDIESEGGQPAHRNSDAARPDTANTVSPIGGLRRLSTSLRKRRVSDGGVTGGLLGSLRRTRSGRRRATSHDPDSASNSSAAADPSNLFDLISKLQDRLEDQRSAGPQPHLTARLKLLAGDMDDESIVPAIEPNMAEGVHTATDNSDLDLPPPPNPAELEGFLHTAAPVHAEPSAAEQATNISAEPACEPACDPPPPSPAVAAPPPPSPAVAAPPPAPPSPQSTLRKIHNLASMLPSSSSGALPPVPRRPSMESEPLATAAPAPIYEVPVVKPSPPPVPRRPSLSVNNQSDHAAAAPLYEAPVALAAQRNDQQHPDSGVSLAATLPTKSRSRQSSVSSATGYDTVFGSTESLSTAATMSAGRLSCSASSNSLSASHQGLYRAPPLSPPPVSPRLRRASIAPSLAGVPENADINPQPARPRADPPPRPPRPTRGEGANNRLEAGSSSTLAAPQPAFLQPLFHTSGTPSPPPSSSSSSAQHAASVVEPLTPAQLIEALRERERLEDCPWYIGCIDRALSERLLSRWPTGTFCVRISKDVPVLSLKFPSSEKKYFHVRVTVKNGKLVHFYVQNPHKFFCGMNPDERMRQVLTPYVKPDLLDTALQLESASDV